MLGWACKREDRKRRSMARWERASISMSASHSSVAAALRFLAAASVRVVSSWRLMVDRLSWFSFCSRGVIGFLSRLEDEGVVFEQRQGICDEFVEQRIAQNQRWLWAAGRLLLAKDVGDIVGAERAGRCSFLDRASHRFGSILTNEFEQFRQLA